MKKLYFILALVSLAYQSKAMEHQEKPDRLLIQAIQKDDAHAAIAALQNGAYVNCFLRNESGDSKTPLEITVEKGNKQMCEVLLAYNPRLYSLKDFYKPFWQLALECGQKDIFKLLYTHQKKVTNFLCCLRHLKSEGNHFACVAYNNAKAFFYHFLKEHWRVINSILSINHCPKYYSRGYQTLLMFEAAKGNLETCKTLLEAGARPDIIIRSPGLKGYSALSIARRKTQSPHHQEIIDLLIQYGATE